MLNFFGRVDSVPVSNDSLSYELDAWMMNLVDSINSIAKNAEMSADMPRAPQVTTAQINEVWMNVPNGTFWYCTDSVPPAVVWKIDNTLVQMDTSPFP